MGRGLGEVRIYPAALGPAANGHRLCKVMELSGFVGLLLNLLVLTGLKSHVYFALLLS